MMQEHEVLTVQSIVVDDKVVVAESWKDVCAIYTPQKARSRALNILRAAAYAESEASIFKAITGVGQHKGFGEISKKALSTAVEALEIIRKERLPLPEDIRAIFGFNTKLPLVDLTWKKGHKISLRLGEAKKHAISLLECAESVETDSFLLKHLERDDWQYLMDEFRLERQKSWTEGLI
ncbi:MAG: hypothetical protein KME29_05100 [Calothrix sp. FI2-JRJ7]|jgi:hypothetical protein|nr:hypothetical protein [Calothrix sp. FI2-JRJ7]